MKFFSVGVCALLIMVLPFFFILTIAIAVAMTIKGKPQVRT